jgi:hypothetical protein
MRGLVCHEALSVKKRRRHVVCFETLIGRFAYISKIDKKSVHLWIKKNRLDITSYQ